MYSGESFFTAMSLMMSSVSSYFAQIDAMRWTPQMQESLRALADHGTREDQLLTLQVRYQLLGQEAVQIRDRAQAFRTHGSRDASPAFLYLSGLQKQLEDLRASIPAALASEGSWLNLLRIQNLSWQLITDKQLTTKRDNRYLIVAPVLY
jgi:hypothetical protein